MLAPPMGTGERHPERPSGAQAGGELTRERSTALHAKGLLDGVVRDPH